MEELDFLFIYEHKVRELENLCLMKYELDRRGYRTRIAYIDDARNALAVKPVYHAKVLCTMACYNNHTLQWHAKDFVRFDKVIDLQWENIVYPKDEHREGAFKNYLEIGKDVVRVSWGKQNVTRLLEAAHMDPKKVKLVGHVGMDFLRKPLSNYYSSRKELFSRYQIPNEKRVILFASPYYGDSLDEAYIEDMCMRFGDDWVNYYQFMCDSQHIVLEWMETLCHNDSDVYVIFRPHPGHPSRMAEQIEKECDNFRIIGTESVKQWILACDMVYTGNSSVIVEAFFARKMCQLLFPIPVTEGFELKLVSDSKKLSTWEEFEKSVYSDSQEFPTPQESIEEIYMIDWDKPSYIRFADMAEEVLKDDYYRLTREQLKGYQNYTFPERLIKAASRITPLYKLYLGLLGCKGLKLGFLENQRKLRGHVFEIEKENAHELTSEQEIADIIGRIKTALESEEDKK